MHGNDGRRLEEACGHRGTFWPHGEVIADRKDHHFRTRQSRDQLERFGGMGLMLVLYLLSRFGILSVIISPVMNFMIRALLLY